MEEENSINYDSTARSLNNAQQQLQNNQTVQSFPLRRRSEGISNAGSTTEPTDLLLQSNTILDHLHSERIKKRKIAIIGIFIAVLLALGVAGILSILDNTIKSDPICPNPTIKCPPPTVKDPGWKIEYNATINSYDDLKAVSSYPETLDIFSLTSSLPDTPPNIFKRLSITVKRLNILGEVSEEWLLYLTSMFPNVHTMQINIDGLCQGSSEKDKSKLKPIVANALTRLILEETNLCPMINWIFLSKFPHLEDLHLKHVELTKKSFKAFCNFLDQTQKTIEFVEVENCILCNDCDLSQVPQNITFKVS